MRGATLNTRHIKRNTQYATSDPRAAAHNTQHATRTTQNNTKHATPSTQQATRTTCTHAHAICMNCEILSQQQAHDRACLATLNQACFSTSHCLADSPPLRTCHNNPRLQVQVLASELQPLHVYDNIMEDCSSTGQMHLRLNYGHRTCMRFRIAKACTTAIVHAGVMAMNMAMIHACAMARTPACSVTIVHACVVTIVQAYAIVTMKACTMAILSHDTCMYSGHSTCT